MKLETVVVVAKALCYVMIGFFTPLTVALAQWANSGEWPSRIVWVVIGASCFVGAATQLLSFLSGSYSDYVANRNAPAPAPALTTDQNPAKTGTVVETQQKTS